MEIDFSKRSKEAILHARNEAMRFKSSDITPEHLFLGIVKTDDQTRNLLLDLGINVNELVGILSTDLQGRQRNERDKDIALSKSADKIMKLAVLEANILKQGLIEPYHLLLSILREPFNLIHQEFERSGLADRIRKEIGIRVESGILKSKKGFLSSGFEKKNAPLLDPFYRKFSEVNLWFVLVQIFNLRNYKPWGYWCSSAARRPNHIINHSGQASRIIAAKF